MVSDLSQMIDPKPVETPIAVVLGDGRDLMATHRGQAVIPSNVWLRDVLYVPGLEENLFSISTAASLKGARIVMERGLCRVMLDGKEALSAKKDRDGGVSTSGQFGFGRGHYRLSSTIWPYERQDHTPNEQKRDHS
jgi:hypothetical protein